MTYRYTVTSVKQHGDIAEIIAEPARKALRFAPGQYASVGFISRGRPSPMRCFSLIGDGSGKQIRIAARITGDFTLALAGLQSGDQLKLQGPFGRFYIDHAYDTRVVMLASGIGITPMLSLLQRPPAMPLTLLYSNKSAQAIPFRDELTSYARQYPNLEVGFFASHDLDNAKNVIAGRIDEAYLSRVTTGMYTGSTYFICGSASFTDRIQQYLLANGVSEDRIVTESFSLKSSDAGVGYTGVNRWVYGTAAAVFAVAVLGIAALDLSRAVPKLAAHTTTAQAASSTANTADSPSASTTDDTTTTTNTSASPSNSASQQSYYQQPISSVS